jgi:hypothetical protein
MNETASPGRWESRWDNLPDPASLGEGRSSTCSIAIDEGLWSHNSFKHFKDSGQPWDDLLGDILCAEAWRLAQSEGTLPERIDILHRIAEVLKEEVCRCLQRPQVLVFDLHEATDKQKWLLQRWLLILPAGALLRAKKSKQTARTAFAETCYFPDTLRHRPTEMRWIDLLEELVLAFGKIEGNRIVLRDKNEHLSAGPGRPGVRYKDWRPVEAQKICFVIPESWGFGSNLKPEPWRRNAVPSWTEPGVATATSPITSVSSPLSPRPKWEGTDV